MIGGGRRQGLFILFLFILTMAIVAFYRRTTVSEVPHTVITLEHSTAATDALHTSHPGQKVPENTIHLDRVHKQFASPLTEEAVNGVEKFVFFIGHGRTGHSIIGSMMDAHPNMVITHEYMLFHKLIGTHFMISKEALFNELYWASYNDVRSGWGSRVRGVKGYSLRMKSSWQGRFQNLKVIGDKSGGNTTRTYSRFPAQFAKAYAQLTTVVQVPIRVIHVVRNPFDVITTKFLYRQSPIRDKKVTSVLNIKKYYNTTGLEKVIDEFFEEVQGEANMIHPLNLTVIEIHYADFIKDSRKTIRNICKFLDLECPVDYVQACHEKAYTSNSRSRDLLAWTQTLIANVSDRMSKYSLFRRYSFDTD